MATSSDQSQRPQVLLISLAFESWHDDIYSGLIDQLSDQVQIKRVRKSDVALRFLTENNPKAIIVTDGGIHEDRNSVVLDRLVQFTLAGGTLIFGFVFSSFTTLDGMEDIFSSFGLPWKRGDYERSTFALNRRAIRDLNGLNLSPAYSQKALRVKDIDPQNALYLARSESVRESNVFASTPVDRSEAPIAWTKIGEGHLGYIGDVNGEEESHQVVMAMCGLG